MKYTITMQCGHDELVTLYGSRRDRERKIEWLENNCVCNECKKKAYAEENEKSAQNAKSLGLPALKGSLKQIAWAESIRMNYINKSKGLQNYILQHATEASEWIEYRDAPTVFSCIYKFTYYSEKYNLPKDTKCIDKRVKLLESIEYGNVVSLTDLGKIILHIATTATDDELINLNNDILQTKATEIGLSISDIKKSFSK